MTDQSTDTKEKIMKVARILFADQGFEGTSIREIAKAADVNVASVNYHFSNKENLFLEILRAGYLETSALIKNFSKEKNPSVEDTLIYLFRHFTDRSHDLISFFKMMMSSQHSKHLPYHETEEGLIGPPGGDVLVEAILKEVGTKLSDEDIHWALKCLFSHVVHNAIMFHCCFKSNNVPFSSPADIESNIRRLTRVVLKDLKA